MSPLGPMGDPSFVSREVRSHVNELDWEAANKELRHQSREGRPDRESFASAGQRIVRQWLVAARRAVGRPVRPSPEGDVVASRRPLEP